MHVSVEHIVTAIGSLAAGGGGVFLWQHWMRRSDRKQDAHSESITDMMVRLERVTTKLEGLGHIPDEMQKLDKRVTIVEHRNENVERDLNGLGAKVQNYINGG